MATALGGVRDHERVKLGSIRPKSIHLLNSLPFASSSDWADLKEIFKLLNNNFLGEENLSYERFRFYQRTQAQDESIERFIGDLRVLAHTCNFVKNSINFSQQMLRKRIICGC